MLRFEWSKGTRRQSGIGPMSRHRATGAPRTRFLPRVDLMENRTLLSTLTVTNNHDSGTGSLRAEIAAASSGDTINFSSKLKGATITLTSGELLITHSVTINGPGADQLTVSGNNASRIFELSTGLNVTISGLTITDGYALEQGGGILNDGSNLTLSDDVLSQNVALGSATNDFNKGAVGGALDSESGTLEITGCTISGNQALGGESAVGQGFGGGVEILAGNATVNDSRISDNLARGADNSSSGQGQSGAIDLEAGTLVVSNTIISGNQAVGGSNTGGLSGDGLGGGITNFGPLTVTNCTFSGNSAVGGNGGTGEFQGQGDGGAVYSILATASISGSTFDQNKAIGGNDATGLAAGQTNGGALLLFHDSATISGSAFSQNQAIGGSDGSSGAGNAGSFVDFGYGGAITVNTSASVNITASSFSHNQAIGGNNATATATDIVQVGGAQGGALYTGYGDAATLALCTFDHNQAIGGQGNTGSGPFTVVGTGEGGAIYSALGGGTLGPNTLTVSNSTLTQNNAQGGDNNRGSASVAGLVGAGVGAGIENEAGSTASVSDSDLDHNQASGGHGNTATAEGTGAVFAGLGAGGGIFNFLGAFNSSEFGNLNASVVTVSNSIVGLNLAQGGGDGNGEGGGIYVGSGTTATIDQTIITLNLAVGGLSGWGGSGGQGIGGALYIATGGSGTLEKSLVIGNWASTSNHDIYGVATYI
jgi:hypothetical protein